MRLAPAAAMEVCASSAERGFVVARIEGGLWREPFFESRLDCIWSGSHPPLSREEAHANNLEAWAYIQSQAAVHGAFILTAPPITGWLHKAPGAAV
jgi:hypothetical protein